LPVLTSSCYRVVDRSAPGIVCGKRGVDVVVGGKRIRQRLRVAARLGDAEPHMRARGRSGIADQRDAPVHDARRGEVVDRREERALDVAQAIDKSVRHDFFGVGAHLRDEILADERRRDRVFVPVAVFIDAHVLERLRVADPVPDEIVAPVAGPQVRSRERGPATGPAPCRACRE